MKIKLSRKQVKSVQYILKNAIEVNYTDGEMGKHLIRAQRVVDILESELTTKNNWDVPVGWVTSLTQDVDGVTVTMDIENDLLRERLKSDSSRFDSIIRGERDEDLHSEFNKGMADRDQIQTEFYEQMARYFFPGMKWSERMKKRNQETLNGVPVDLDIVTDGPVYYSRSAIEELNRQRSERVEERMRGTLRHFTGVEVEKDLPTGDNRDLDQLDRGIVSFEKKEEALRMWVDNGVLPVLEMIAALDADGLVLDRDEKGPFYRFRNIPAVYRGKGYNANQTDAPSTTSSGQASEWPNSVGRRGVR